MDFVVYYSFDSKEVVNISVGKNQKWNVKYALRFFGIFLELS